MPQNILLCSRSSTIVYEGGEIVNLGLLMNIGAPSMPMNSSASTANVERKGFGSVFQDLMSATALPVAIKLIDTEQELTELLGDVLNAGSLEELEGFLEELERPVKSTAVAGFLKDSGMLRDITENDVAVKTLLSGILEGDQLQNKPVELSEDAELRLTDLPNLQEFPSLQQLAHLISEKPDKLVETITNVLEDVGMTKEQLDQMATTGDIWFMLDVLQKLPTEKVQAAIEKILPKVTVELTVLLKAIELAAPKMDLFTKQIDLVETIKPILSQFAGQLEQKIVQPEVKQPLQIPPTMQHIVRFMTEQSAADTKQQDQQSKPNETVTPVLAATQNETRPVFQMNATEKVPESRSEALMREFQAVLNRANFGQTNGMNRISIKLYPEHLGQIRVELLEVNGVMTARILASTAMAREMLDSQMHQLRQAFTQQNLQVERIDLSQTLQDPSKSDREQAFNKQNQQQKEQATEQNETQDEQEQTFQEFMIELEV